MTKFGPFFCILLVCIGIRQIVAINPTCPSGTSYDTIPPSAVGICQTYVSDLPDGSLSFCNGIVNYPYFLPNGFNQTFLDQKAEVELVATPAASLLLPLLPNRCTSQMKRAVCLSVFQACEMVDPYYVDQRACPMGEICAACGDITSPFPPDLYDGTHNSPSYGSVCVTLLGAVSGTPRNCIVGPGKVPGFGDVTWELLKTIMAPTLSMVEFCQLKGLTYSAQFNSCMASIPRSPCKSECDQLWNMDKTVIAGPRLAATCPLVSGNFTAKLQFLQNFHPDSYVRQQAATAVDLQTSGQTTIGLVPALNLAPNCLKLTDSNTFVFSENLIQESSLDRNLSLGALMTLQASTQQLVAGKCHCVKNYLTDLTGALTSETCHPAFTGDSYCLSIFGSAQCSTLGNSNVEANPSIRFADASDSMNPICKTVIQHPKNQPSNATLDLLVLANGLANRSQAEGVYFVAPTPGLPTLAVGKMSTRNLCSFNSTVNPSQSFVGRDSHDCAVANVNAAIETIPKFVKGTCRLRFLDLLCQQAHMKLEFKTLCLRSDQACAPFDVQGAETNAIGFTFALPKFVDQSLCQEMRQDCGGFIESLGPIGTAKRDAIEAAMNCAAPIQQTCSANNVIDGWTSNVWKCDSPFNGLPSYPTDAQILADFNSLLGSYPSENLMDFSLLGVSATSLASVSNNQSSSIVGTPTCECPFPLVVPDNPNAETLDSVVCCQERCGRNLFTKEQFDTITILLKVLPLIGALGALFVVLTWGLFKIKRSQPLVFFFAVGSFNGSLVYIIPMYSKPDPREYWCKDNTQANVMEDGGMCIFQGIWLTYFSLCVSCFWLMQVVDLYLRICKNQIHMERYTKYYYAFAWGYPLLVVVVIALTSSFGYSQGNIFCFIRDNPLNPELVRGLDLALCYGSINAIWIIGTVLMCRVLYQIYVTTSNTANLGQGKLTVSKRYAIYRTSLFFVLFFDYVWVSISGWRFSFDANKAEITVCATDWITCLFTNFAAGIDNPGTSPLANNSILHKYGFKDGQGCGLNYPCGLPFSSWIYLVIITSLQGLFIFFIFGARFENFRLWKEKLGLTSKNYDTDPNYTSSHKMKIPQLERDQSSSRNLNASFRVGNSAVMAGGVESGKFIAVSEVDQINGRNQLKIASYMDE